MKRIKRRYILLNLDTDHIIEEREFIDTIWASLYKIYGEYGASQANLAPINFNGAAKQAILRVNLAIVDQTRTAIATITSISGKPATVHVVAVSGTIKSLRQKASAA